MARQFNFKSGQYLKLREIIPALKSHGLEKIEYHPDGDKITFFGDPLAAATSGFKAGELNDGDVQFIFEICNPTTDKDHASKTSEQMTIKISYTEDGMFGPAEENRAGVNIPASFARYEEMLTAKLQSEYPDAEIEIENGIQDKTEAYPDFEDELSWIQEIVGQVWQSWGWVVAEQIFDTGEYNAEAIAEAIENGEFPQFIGQFVIA